MYNCMCSECQLVDVIEILTKLDQQWSIAMLGNALIILDPQREVVLLFVPQPPIMSSLRNILNPDDGRRRTVKYVFIISPQIGYWLTETLGSY